MGCDLTSHFLLSLRAPLRDLSPLVQFSRSVVSDSLQPHGLQHARLSITNSRSLLKLMSIASMMPSNHLILCRPLLLLPSIFPTCQFGLLLSMVASMQLTFYIPEGFRRNASRDQVGVQAPSAASSAPGLQAVARGRVPAWGTR